MATLPTHTAEEVYKASSLSPEHFETEETGPLTNMDMVAKIEAEILPDIVSDANLSADEAAAPYDYPFAYETLRAAYPTKDDLSINEWIQGQDGRWRRVILWEALAEMYRRVVSLDDAYDKKAAMYAGWAAQKRKDAVKAIGDVVSKTAAAKEEGVEIETGIEVVYFNNWPCTGL